MPPKAKPTNWGMYAKMLIGGGTMVIGGPALVYYVTPTEEQLFLKYNPELQKRSLENRAQKEQDFEDFVQRLKVYSRSEKHIWEAAADAEREAREGKITEQARLMQEMRERKEKMRKDGVRMVPGGSL